MWVDNFSKMWKVARPDVSSGTYRDANNTGIAVRDLSMVDVDLKIVKVNNTVVPCMPSFDELRPLLEKAVKMMLANEAKPYRWKDSLCYRFDVNTVPPTMFPPQGDPLYELWHNRQSNNCTMYPVRIDPYNIGSKEGLLTFCKQYYEEWIKPTKNKGVYKATVMDVNIYWRSIKV